jgi:hypothetical protein
MTKRIIASTLIACSTAVLAAAQAPQSDRPSSSAQEPAATTTAQQASTTLVGCLYRENQVPGRKPNVAEKAGVLEDYILADATFASAAARPGATPGATGTTGAVPTQGTMYKVEKIADERLKALVGKRVEVTGKIDSEGGSLTGGPTKDRGIGPDKINLPEFEAASIREISGTCPATPAPAK